MADRKQKDTDLAPTQKAKPVAPPDTARRVPAPFSMFGDARVPVDKQSGVKDFAPSPVREDAAGNGASTSEGDAG